MSVLAGQTREAGAEWGPSGALLPGGESGAEALGRAARPASVI